MIKLYEDWKNEQPHNFTTEKAYNAGVKEAKAHYEEEFVNTAEYFDSVLRRTSDINFDIALKIVELADIIPNVGEEVPPDFPRICREFSEVMKVVKK